MWIKARGFPTLIILRLGNRDCADSTISTFLTKASCWGYDIRKSMCPHQNQRSSLRWLKSQICCSTDFENVTLMKRLEGARRTPGWKAGACRSEKAFPVEVLFFHHPTQQLEGKSCDSELLRVLEVPFLAVWVYWQKPRFRKRQTGSIVYLF